MPKRPRLAVVGGAEGRDGPKQASWNQSWNRPRTPLGPRILVVRLISTDPPEDIGGIGRAGSGGGIGATTSKGSRSVPGTSGPADWNGPRVLVGGTAGPGKLGLAGKIGPMTRAPSVGLGSR